MPRSVSTGCIVFVLLGALLAVSASAQDLNAIRIGTGSTGGTYFPVGGLIANTISKPPGSRDCSVGGSCGVPGLIAAAVSTKGSIQNVTEVSSGRLDLALAQADVAYNAYYGTGRFAETGRLANLRVIASLFGETVHIVVKRGSDIDSVSDLAGKRVAVGDRESGTLVVAEIILEAFGLTDGTVEIVYENLGKATGLFIGDDLDAYFMVAGDPVRAIVLASETVAIDLVPIAGEPAEEIAMNNPFLVQTTIPSEMYQGVEDTRTLKVAAQLVVSADAEADLVYGITQALWHPNSRKILESGHPNAREIQLETALESVAIPIHPGALRYYVEAGLIPVAP